MQNTTSCDPQGPNDGRKTVGHSANYGQQTVGSSDLISGDTTLHNSILLQLELASRPLTQEDLWLRMGRIELATEISIALSELDSIGLIQWREMDQGDLIGIQPVYSISHHGKNHLASLLAHGMASGSGEDFGDVSDHLIHIVPKPNSDSSPFSMGSTHGPRAD